MSLRRDVRGVAVACDLLPKVLPSSEALDELLQRFNVGLAKGLLDLA